MNATVLNANNIFAPIAVTAMYFIFSMPWNNQTGMNPCIAIGSNENQNTSWWALYFSEEREYVMIANEHKANNISLTQRTPLRTAEI
jgi:hypothetical protein